MSITITDSTAAVKGTLFKRNEKGRRILRNRYQIACDASLVAGAIACAVVSGGLAAPCVVMPVLSLADTVRTIQAENKAYKSMILPPCEGVEDDIYWDAQ